MSSVLQHYYQGITQQLRSEVDFINSLFEHQGVKGAGNETVLRELITKFIPKKYGIGTGVVIDQNGNSSRQCDIVIYDTFLYPSLLSLTSIHLFPVDIVYAVIEVKTTLNSQTAKDSIENIASVKSLDFVKADFGDNWASKNTQTFGIRRATSPLGFVFAYNSDAQQDETFKKWFTPTNEDTLLYPSLIGCLDIGIAAFTDDEHDEVGGFSVHPEIGMKSVCKTFPVARKKASISSIEVEAVKDVEVLNITSMPESKQWLHEGILYPVKKIGKDFMAIDQSRVLLNFLLQLNELLTYKRINPSFSFMGTYMKALDIFHFSF